MLFRSPPNDAHARVRICRPPAADQGFHTPRSPRHCERRVAYVRWGEAISWQQGTNDEKHKGSNVNVRTMHSCCATPLLKVCVSAVCISLQMGLLRPACPQCQRARLAMTHTRGSNMPSACGGRWLISKRLLRIASEWCYVHANQSAENRVENVKLIWPYTYPGDDKQLIVSSARG